jgi:hypothetical protein
MFPALALVLGFELTRLSTGALKWMALPLAVGAATLLIAQLLFFDVLVERIAEARTPASIYAQFGPWVSMALAAFTAAGVAAFALFRRGTPASKTWGIAALSLLSLVGLQLAFKGHDAFRVVRSAHDILRAAERANGGPLDPAYAVYQVESYDQTLPFYLRRPTPLVTYRDEMALGLDAEPQKGYSEEAWRAAWLAAPQAYALLELGTAAQLAAKDIPMVVLARDPRRVFVARR